MLLTLLACAPLADTGVTGTTEYEGGWAEVPCDLRADPDRWAIDIEEPAPVYFLMLRELADGPSWIGGISPTWDEARDEYQQLDPNGVTLDCRAWVAL